MSTLNRAVFTPTVIVGIYKHDLFGTYHLRNLRTGQMLHRGYSTIDEARLVQELLENNPDSLSDEVRQELSRAYHPASEMGLDALIKVLASELAEWEKLSNSFTFNLEAANARLSR